MGGSVAVLYMNSSLLYFTAIFFFLKPRRFQKGLSVINGNWVSVTARGAEDHEHNYVS